MSENIHQGGCSCGDSRYETNSDPEELEFVIVDIANLDLEVLLELALGLKRKM